MPIPEGCVRARAHRAAIESFRERDGGSMRCLQAGSGTHGPPAHLTIVSAGP
jgi:hypothetical protein